MERKGISFKKFYIILNVLWHIPAWTAGCDGHDGYWFLSYGVAARPVGPGFGHVVKIAGRGKGGSHAVHGRLDGHLAVARMQKRRWVDPVPGKEIPCNAARILVGVKKNKIFMRELFQIQPWIGKALFFFGLRISGGGSQAGSVRFPLCGSPGILIILETYGHYKS